MQTQTIPTQTEEVAQISDVVRTGRPLIKVNVNGVLLTGFVDTGSEMTIIKDEILPLLKIKKPLTATRHLRGVSGKALSVNTECNVRFSVNEHVSVVHRIASVPDLSFPGDVLLGIDILRRFNFHFIDRPYPEKSYMVLQGVKVPVTYTDEASLGVCVVSYVTSVGMECIGKTVHVLHKVVCPPKSGVFVKAKVPHTFIGECAMISGAMDQIIVPRSLVNVNDHMINVWVVNPGNRPYLLKAGARVATVSEVAEVVAMGDHERFDEQGEDSQMSHETEESPVAPVHLPEMDGYDFDQEFDWQHGVLDFGYSQNDFMIFPDIDPDPTAHDVSNVNACAPITKLDLNFDHLDAQRQDQLNDVLMKYPNLFSGDKCDIGTIPNIEHRIVTNEIRPVCNRQWRLPESTKSIIRKECEQMAKAGVIEPSTSPWLSPVVLVRKKDGTVRFCVDYRGLNAVTIADTYPLPRIDELLDDLGNASCFSLLDSRSAYWSVKVAKEDRPKTAFADGHRLWQFKRLPFGLATAPTTFQRTMNLILTSVLGRHTLAYLDDVIVYSPNFDEHLSHLDETLSLLSKAGLKLNSPKCEFAKSEIKFLGFKVSKDGVSPDPEKVKSIEEMPAPRNVKEVRRFLGATGFFRKHIKAYASIAAPLSRLTRKDTSFVWGKEEENAFCKLKQTLATAPVLRRPDYDVPFEIHTDASKVAIGACLMQRGQDNVPYAVAYYSRKMQDAESRYPPIDMEALAVVEGVRVFDPYVYGRKFDIYTDHRPLTYVFSRKTKSPRMSRWSHELSFYQYRLLYKKGASHHVPDLLSRAVNAIDLGNPDPEQIREAQMEDPLWREVIQYLEEQALPRHRIPLALGEFELKDGVLYHVRQLPERVIHQLVVPKVLRLVALKLAHASLAAHPGVYRTYCKLRDLFYFPNLLRETKKYVQGCQQCQHRKGAAFRNAPMANIPDVTVPLERVSADLIDLHSSESGHRYVLSIIDHLTRYLQLIPLKSKNAETVTEAIFENFITIFGPPRILQTDHGSEFTNKLFAQVCKLVNIKTSFTTQFHPQANGLIERSNRVVKDALATLTEARPRTWPEYLPQVRLAVNTAVHRSTGEQPLYLLMGHHGYFPVGVTNQVEYAERSSHYFHERLQTARAVAVEASRRAQEGWAKHYNKGIARNLQLTLGSLVLRRDYNKTPGISQRFRERWVGPGRVIKRLGPVIYLVRDTVAPYTLRKCHINHLKVYYPSQELEYTDIPVYSDNDPHLPLDLADPDDPNPAQALEKLLLSAAQSPET